jgi:Zn-dependent peptidase ImmA (M78 family)
MLAELAPEELADALDAVAADVLEAAGVYRPPVDAFAVARALGLTVAEDDRQRGRARFVRLKRRGRTPPQATILLRPDPRPERRQWAVAHEIGEHVACRIFERLWIDPREADPAARERTANQLAGRLLLPAEWFGRDGPDCGWDLVELKTRYATASHELIARRMLDFPPPVVITVYDHARVTLRRSNVAGRVPPPSARETDCWRRAHETGLAYQATEGTCTVRAWPVHEEGWKREIVRTEVNA